MALRLVKGGVDPQAPDAEHKVDALAGATLTSDGVSNLVRYWMSEDGFKPFLERLATQHAGAAAAPSA